MGERVLSKIGGFNLMNLFSTKPPPMIESKHKWITHIHIWGESMALEESFHLPARVNI